MHIKTTQNFNENLKTMQFSKQKVLQQVSTTLIDLYWEIEKYISTKMINENWGKSVIEDLVEYIKIQEPVLKGFTARNLWRMKQFYETYKDNGKLIPLVIEVSWTNNLIILSSATKIENK